MSKEQCVTWVRCKGMMEKEAIIDELRILISDYLMNKSLELVDLIYRYEGRDLFLRVLTDRPEGGISLGECAILNREISDILDTKDILQQRYILEVSSPGLDRPLLIKNDFLRCIGKNVHFFMLEPVNGKLELEGLITKVEDKSVYVDIDSDIVQIDLVKIRKGKQIIP